MSWSTLAWICLGLAGATILGMFIHSMTGYRKETNRDGKDGW